jgi:hypothetical protein
MNTGTSPFFVNTKLPGNTADKTTLRPFLEQIERRYGKARRVWLMDRGVPTEEVLAEMRAADPPVHYLVGTPKGRLTRLEKHLIELYVLAHSRDRVPAQAPLTALATDPSSFTSARNASMPETSRENNERPLSGCREAMRTAKSASCRWRTMRRPRNPVPPNTVTRRQDMSRSIAPP